MNNIETIKVLGCTSPYCKGSSNCPGYLFSYDEGDILLDCGPGISRMFKMPEDLFNLSIIISHLHKDHYTELFLLGYASFCYHRLGMLDERIDVYIPKMNPDENGYDDYRLILDNKENYFNIVTYDPNSVINIKAAEVSFYKNHHSVKAYSTKIHTSKSTIVYTGDMGFKSSDAFIPFCQNADLLICEATYLSSDNVVDENHLHAHEAGLLAKNSNVKILLLTHFWPEHNKEEYVAEAREIFPNVYAAFEGMQISVGVSVL